MLVKPMPNVESFSTLFPDMKILFDAFILVDRDILKFIPKRLKTTQFIMVVSQIHVPICLVLFYQFVYILIHLVVASLACKDSVFF